METNLLDPMMSAVADSNEELQRLRSEVDAYGFAYSDQLLDEALLESLEAEARVALGNAVEAEDDGVIRYRAKMGNLCEVGQAFLADPRTTSLLSSIFDEPVVLSQEASCYTFYSAGDHLGRHQDRADSCQVTLIAYLDALRPKQPPASTGLELRVYGWERPNDDDCPKVVIPTLAGRLVVGRGSEVWHERPRLAEGEHVIALTSCFHLQCS